jgi:hypothetical protein
MKLTTGDLLLFPGQRIPDQFLPRKSQTKGENATTIRVSGQISVRILLPQFTTKNFMPPNSHKNFPRVAGESRTRFVERAFAAGCFDGDQMIAGALEWSTLDGGGAEVGSDMGVTLPAGQPNQTKTPLMSV